MKLPQLRPTRTVLSVGALALAALIALLVAWGAVGAIESASKTSVERALLLNSQDWAEVEVDGLQVILTGIAPDEQSRFRALSAAAGEVEASRVIDRTGVVSAQAITPPRFSVEILRNESGISMIGLIPAATDREALARRVGKIDPVKQVTDLLETADYPVPQNWDPALAYAVDALALLPRSKISMDASRVAVEAIADSAEQKASWEKTLSREAPGGVKVALDISAPRPVITPFTLRFTQDEAGARFDACTAHTEAGLGKIVAAGVAAGVKGQPDCTVALGVPSPDWPDAVARGIAAVHELGGGALTFSDADVTLVAPAGTPQDSYDRVVGELEADLPDVFSLHAVLTPSESSAAAGPPEFTATLGADGRVQLRGRVADEQERTITESFARARFGSDKVYAATRLDAALPPGWSVRTLAALEALSQLDSGIATVQPNVVDVTGTTGDKGAKAEISRVLSEKLGEGEDFRVNVRYDESLDPVASQPSPTECAAAVNAEIAKAKITFAPGSANIEAGSGGTIDRIADILKTCPDVTMEVGGYTDSQGSETMNKSLSQQRADAVLSALLARRVLTSNLTAHGYGEENPIASNETEEGREANRRIEFRLIGASAAMLEGGPIEQAEADVAAEAETAPAVVDEQTPTEDTVRPKPRPEGLELPAGVEAVTVAEEAPAEDAEAVPADTAADAEATDAEAAPAEEPAAEATTDAATDDTAAPEDTPADTAAPAEEPAAEATTDAATGDTVAPEDTPADTAAPAEEPAAEATTDAAAGDTVAPESTPADTAAPVEEPAPEATTGDTVAPDDTPAEVPAPAADTASEDTAPVTPAEDTAPDAATPAPADDTQGALEPEAAVPATDSAQAEALEPAATVAEQAEAAPDTAALPDDQTADAAASEELPPPVVVHPDLADKRPKPRPAT